MKTFFKTQVFPDIHETANRLAMDIIRFSEYQLQYRDKLYIALSGGSTPQLMFNIMATEYPRAMDWKRVHFFWVDERCVPYESPESNFGNADRILFNKIGIPKENLHPVHGKEDPLNEVVRYTGEILANVPYAKNFPVFDIILLGMGNDGHTASIFPGQSDLFETPALCAISEHPDTKQKRITLTGKVINNASEIIFLITGEAKAERLKSIFSSENSDGIDFPAQKIKPVSGNLTWYLDKEASKYLETSAF